MKSFTAVSVAALATLASATPMKRDNAQGIDISAFQPNINWSSVKNDIDFVYIKATEGVSYRNPSFSSQWSGATNANLIRGAYHFAHPNSGPGADQAQYFHSNGGGWSDDGYTLPGSLDIEYAPKGNSCYGLSQSSMSNWIGDFSDEYHSLTGRNPVIYTTTDWWKTCTGNDDSFGNSNPLWIAHYTSDPGPLPAGWDGAAFWQFADKGSDPGDQDYFGGDMQTLVDFATGK
ncbi:glycoside hydrolase family 25 protein [Hydnomerulius pinastri MD-312]|nr:glycoside hydrolase family 25 protein [Hydnomerulius pinastri MD-312]